MIYSDEIESNHKSLKNVKINSLMITMVFVINVVQFILAYLMIKLDLTPNHDSTIIDVNIKCVTKSIV